MWSPSCAATSKAFRSCIRAGRGCAYVPTTEAWLRVTGMWIGCAAPQPGDVAVLGCDGCVADHIGIVERETSLGEIVTIEGNTCWAQKLNPRSSGRQRDDGGSAWVPCGGLGGGW